jgi:hypothetical protein
MQPSKPNFTHCSGILRLRGGQSTSEDSSDAALPGMHVFTPDGAHRIGIDFAEDYQGAPKRFCVSGG